MTLEYVALDRDLADRLRPVARRIFTDTFAAGYERDPFEAFCDAAYGPDGTMARDLRSPDIEWLVATCAGEPIGYAKLTPLRAPAPEPAPNAMEAQQLYVLSEYHGTGVAAALMDWAIDTARARHATELYLTVFDHNERAKRFYARYGFREVGHCTFQLGERTDDDRVWCKPLVYQG